MATSRPAAPGGQAWKEDGAMPGRTATFFKCSLCAFGPSPPTELCLQLWLPLRRVPPQKGEKDKGRAERAELE
eukprot:COSAG04_NODE_4473_length_2067_cov_5.060976_2_plen_73_part_00